MSLELVPQVLIGLIGLLHFYILVLEMFLWTKPAGLKAFRQTPSQAQASAVLAANQGLYNGILAAGLFWSLIQPDSSFAWQLQVFFASCVLVAGLYGGMSVGKKIFYIQGVPALLALLALIVTRN